jgi:hypothetical protein
MTNITRPAARIALAAAFAVAASAPAAVAESCSGVNTRTGAPPVAIMAPEGGGQMLLIRSTGTTTTLEPELAVGWQHCVGVWTAMEDGTGNGRGNCYRVDPDGDLEVISWEGENTSGTWTHVSGTGKYEDLVGGGTYSNAAPMGGESIGMWEGDC